MASFPGVEVLQASGVIVAIIGIIGLIAGLILFFGVRDVSESMKTPNGMKTRYLT